MLWMQAPSRLQCHRPAARRSHTRPAAPALEHGGDLRSHPDFVWNAGSVIPRCLALFSSARLTELKVSGSNPDGRVPKSPLHLTGFGVPGRCAPGATDRTEGA
jgi:hypothetical protein